MARRKKHGGGGHDGGMERWLLTYADMITLLLALFIVLFAMSTIDVVRFDSLKRTLSETFRGQVLTEPGSVLDGSQGALDPSAPSANQAMTVTQLTQEAATSVGSGMVSTAQQLEKQLKKAGISARQASVTTSERGIVISLAGDAFFESGSAELRPQLRLKLNAIVKELRRERRPMSIEGHTDGQPLNGGPYGDNLTLSFARARSVYKFLQAGGVRTDRMHAEGWADSKPVVKPADPLAAVARNRRVEIVVLAPGAGRLSTAGGEAVPRLPLARTQGTASASPGVPSIVKPIVVISHG